MHGGFVCGSAILKACVFNPDTPQWQLKVRAFKTSEREIVCCLERSDLTSFLRSCTDIVRCLEKADLTSFMRSCMDFGIIHDNVKKSFESLDPAVPRHLSIRYLLSHAYEVLKGNPEQCQHLLEVLANHGVSREVLGMVGQGYQDLLEPDDFVQLPGGSGEALSGGVARVGSKRPLCHGSFLERHVSALAELLSECSSKWHVLGVSLNLPTSVLDGIMARYMIPLGIKACLYRVLWEWIVGGHEYAKSPTVECLKQALGSAMVGLDGKASLLQEDILIEHGIYVTGSKMPTLAKRPCLEIPSLRIVSRTHGVVVNEENSTLLEPDDFVQLQGGSGEALSGGVARVGSKRPLCHGSFLERHVSALAELLSECSSKWHDLAVSLNLPTSVLDGIMARYMIPLGIKACLYRVLWEWIVGGHEYAKPPTVECLKQALGSAMVGLGGKASLLQEDILIEHGIYVTGSKMPTLAKRPCLEIPSLRIVSRTHGVVVNEENSTLLEVQVKTRHESNISYQWCKDGLPLVERGDFIGCNKPILCLNNSWVAEGTYVCKVAIEDDSTPAVCSECINVSVSVSPLKKVLVDRYCTQPLQKAEVMTQVELRSNEDEIVRYLEKVDLKSFVRNCAEIGVISKNVKESFEYLDPAVPRPLCIRYLLLHAYEQLEGNSRLSKSWFDLLTKHGVSRHLFKLEQSVPEDSQLSSGHNVQNSHVSLQTMSLAEGIGEELAGVEGGHVATGAKRPPSELVFSEEDVSSLTERLAECSCQWINISINLNLPEHVRKSIKRRMHMHDNDKSCMNEVLREWVVGNHCNAKPPTLQNLLETLRSNTVSLGRIANILQDNYLHENFPIAAKRLCLEPSFLELVSQSPCVLTINDEKSNLLEVQVNKATVFYEWWKDGLPLKEGEDFIGCNKQILCLNNSRVAEGAYVCKVAIEDDSTSAVCSECINVSVSVSPLKKVLVDRYCAQPEIPEDSWPPRSSNTYINLALIRQGNIEMAGEYARNTIQGDMDDVLANKDSIEYEDVFSDLESGTRLLIEGRPGSGKTTLVHKFSRDWAMGNCRLRLKNIKLLFLVHLRGFFNNPHIKLCDIVQKYYLQDDMVKEILKMDGEGLCFILDGLDEYRPKQINNTFIFKLIKKEHLPKAVVIVASRPAATAKLRKIATKQIETVGFMKKQIYEYVEKYPFSNVCKSADLHKYLKQHPNVHHMCYLPIHAAMVCYLFNVVGNTLPRTETEMYKKFTVQTILRTLMKHVDEHVNLLSVDALTGKEKGVFLDICKLAFDKVISSKQVLEQSELCDFAGGNECMGLITVDYMARECGFEKLYTFLHLTFQEYLAAYHLSNLEEEKQLKIINDHCGKKHMSVVWKFYCGLVNFSNQEQKLNKVMSAKDDLFNVHCAFESQQTVTCNYVVRAAECGTLTFNNHFLTPSDMTAIGYVIKNSECPVEKVVLDKCKMGQEGVEALIDESSDKILSVKALSFHGRDCVMKQFELLKSCLRHMTSLEFLDLSKTRLGPKKVEALTKNITLPKLQTLQLPSSELIACANCKYLKLLQFKSLKFKQVMLPDGETATDTDVIVHAFGLLPFLPNSGSESYLDLRDRPFELCDLVVLSESINRFSCCISLYLKDCNLCDNVGALKCLTLLETLDVSVNRINDCGAIAVAENIQHCTKLQKLSMSFNHIGDSGAIAITESLQHLPTMREFDLSYNQIGDEGAITITRALKDRKDFKLFLQINKITKECVSTVTSLKPDVLLEIDNINLDNATAIDILTINIDDSLYTNDIKSLSCSANSAKALFLKHCTNLQKLALRSNSMSNDGAKALADCLKHHTNLQTLHLSFNNIGSDGAKSLADCLKHHTNLQTLHLDSNNIGSDGAKALADCLKHHTNLQTLYLSSNNIGSDGAKALADCLKHHTNLQTLHLSSNNIGSDGAKALADCLKHHTNLQKLYLYFNNIGSDGAKALADCLKHHTNLQTLHLYSNNIGSDGAKALADCLKHGTNLYT